MVLIMKREFRIKELQEYAVFMTRVLSQMTPSNENYQEYKKYLDNSIKEMNDLITNKTDESSKNSKTTVLILESYSSGVINSADIFVSILGAVGLNQKRRGDRITLENDKVKIEIVKIQTKEMRLCDDIRAFDTIKGKRYNLVINNSPLGEDIVKSLIK